MFPISEQGADMTRAAVLGASTHVTSIVRNAFMVGKLDILTNRNGRGSEDLDGQREGADDHSALQRRPPRFNPFLPASGINKMNGQPLLKV
ncbi:MAG: hypothetical protein JRN37_03970 [Nitrososphaerota archaeon]|nr:hypothetical protein [Nitrososphaerota archaeon]